MSDASVLVFELRGLSAEQISYEVALPFDQSTDQISNGIAALNGGMATSSSGK